VLIDQFNAEIATMFDSTRDFIQAHFYLAPRTDTPFWRANKELVLADGIREKIAMYQAGLPVNAPTTDEATYYDNFEAEFRNFWTNGSYYCIFAGMGLLPKQPLPAIAHKPASQEAAAKKLQEVKRAQRELVAQLPTNYDYLRALHGSRDPSITTPDFMTRLLSLVTRGWVMA
jgi:tryptophan halogenase